MFYLYATKRQGYMTKSGNWTTQVSEMKEFTEADAIAQAKKLFGGGQSGIFPVSIRHLKEINVANLG